MSLLGVAHLIVDLVFVGLVGVGLLGPWPPSCSLLLVCLLPVGLQRGSALGLLVCLLHVGIHLVCVLLVCCLQPHRHLGWAMEGTATTEASDDYTRKS